MKALPRCALAGTAERDARDTRVCFTPTGARPAIVTFIAAMVSGVYEVRVRMECRGWRLGRRFSFPATAAVGRQVP